MSSPEDPRFLKSLHLDIETRRLMGILDDETILQFQLTPDNRITFQRLRAATDDVAGPPEAIAREALVDDAVAPKTAPQSSPERQPVSTYTGEIKNEIRQGRPDGQGNPTAWTRWAVHEEGQDKARMLSTTFHRHTVERALSLKIGDQITASGYLRPSNNPERMDSFSVFRIDDYPGKPPKE